MFMIPSIGASGLTQFLQGVVKHKTSQAAAKAQAPTGFGAPASAAGGSALMSQIQQTVTSALQAAKASGSTQDPNQIVEDSIASLLKNVLSGKGGATSPTPVSQQAFQSALQNAGITPQQFHNDLRSAVQDAQNALATPLSSGTALDVTA
jgi:hypothetical protein